MLRERISAEPEIITQVKEKAKPTPKPARPNSHRLVGFL
jgi:hypothetical protein